MKGFSSLVWLITFLCSIHITNRDKIVEKHSALLEVSHEEQIPVDADHSAMCKFETESDDTFEKVYKRIQRMRNNSWHRANEQSAAFSELSKHRCFLKMAFRIQVLNSFTLDAIRSRATNVEQRNKSKFWEIVSN